MYLQLILGAVIGLVLIGLILDRGRLKKKLGSVTRDLETLRATAGAQTAASDALSRLPDIAKGPAEILAEAEAREKRRLGK